MIPNHFFLQFRKARKDCLLTQNQYKPMKIILKHLCKCYDTNCNHNNVRNKLGFWKYVRLGNFLGKFWKQKIVFVFYDLEIDSFTDLFYKV